MVFLSSGLIWQSPWVVSLYIHVYREFLDIFIIWHLIRVFTVCKTLLIQHVQESVVYKRLMLIRWLVLLFQESHWRALGAVSDSSKRRKHIRYRALEEGPSCCLCSSGNHARTQIDLGLPVHHLHRLHVHVPSCCILLTSFFNCWWPPSSRQVWMYAPSNLQKSKYEIIVIENKGSEYNACNSFGNSFLYHGD